MSQEKFLAANDAAARAYFFEADGKPKAVGTILKNPAYAATLRTIAEKGADAYYSGAIAEDIVATVKGHATNPGDMTLADLAAYKVIERPAVCGPYRTLPRFAEWGRHRQAPSRSSRSWRCSRRRTSPAWAWGLRPSTGSPRRAGSRLQIVRFIAGDPAFVDVPVAGLIDPGYLKSRAGLVSPDKSMGRAKAGDPPRKKAFLFAPSDGIENGTSHISIVDADGMPSR